MTSAYAYLLKVKKTFRYVTHFSSSFNVAGSRRQQAPLQSVGIYHVLRATHTLVLRKGRKGHRYVPL